MENLIITIPTTAFDNTNLCSPAVDSELKIEQPLGATNILICFGNICHSVDQDAFKQIMQMLKKTNTTNSTIVSLKRRINHLTSKLQTK